MFNLAKKEKEENKAMRKRNMKVQQQTAFHLLYEAEMNQLPLDISGHFH